VAAAVIATSAVAAAADTPASATTDSGQLEEIVVTARFKSETIDNTPIAITALTGADMDARGMASVLDVANDAPNVVLRTGQSGYGKSAVAFIRGIGQNDFDFALEPGVGIYIDDVYFATIFGSIFDLVDVDRVEVLRGPQGTLFGKNSEGGALRLYSVQPKGDDSGYLDAGYGSFNRERFRAAYDFAIVPDLLSARISGLSNTADGYVKVVDFACAHPALAGNLKPTITLISSGGTGGNCQVGDEGSENTQSIRGEVKWTPSNTFQALLEADFTKDDGSPAPSVMLKIEPNLVGSGLGGFNTAVAIPTYGIPVDSRFVPTNPYTTYSSFADSRLGIQMPKIDDVTQMGGGATLLWDVTDKIRIKSVSGYRDYYGAFAQDADGSPLAALLAYNIVDHHQFSQEVSATGNAELFSRPVEWTVGGFYLDSYSRNSAFVDLAEFGLAFNMNDPAIDINRSGYLHSIYHLTDQLSLELGYRYTRESKDYTFYRGLIELGGAPATGLLFPVTTGRSAFSRSDYKGALSYQITEDTLTYVSVTTGFKAGGINPRPVDAAQIVPFGPETVTSYEAGVKSQLFDKRLNVRFAGFYMAYNNLQQNAVGLDTTGEIADIVTNVGKVGISGLELEVQARPIPELNLDGSIGGLNYHTISLGSAALIPVAAGGPTKDSLPIGVPLLKANVGADYTVKLADFGDLTPRADYTYQSTSYWDLARSSALTMPAYGILNLHLTYKPPKGKWSAALEVTNATNKIYYQNYGPNLAQQGLLDAVIAPPREYLGSVRYTF
jgi:iron complex outermembrane receptor protein